MEAKAKIRKWTLKRKARRLIAIESAPKTKPAPKTVDPREWHRKPPHSGNSCPICGCPGTLIGDHRLASPPDAEFPRYDKRRSSSNGWKLLSLDTTPKRKPQVPTGPTQKTRERIAAAVRLRVVEGKTNAEIAEALKVNPVMIADWRKLYSGLWEAAEQATAAEIVELVRAQAGTDAILDDPDLYLARAKAADKWAAAKGEPLFDHGDAPTLCSFYQAYYKPVRLSDAARTTKITYESAVLRWRLVTGDPPLESITVELLAKFRDCLSRSQGKYSWKRMSPNTIAKILLHIQALLDKAGPPGPRNRDAAGIIDRPPWIRRPRTEPKPVRVIEPETLNAIYQAAVGMETPRIGGLKPAKWWRALLVLTYNTGLRRGSLHQLRWEWVNWPGRLIEIPPRAMKSRRAHITPLNAAALEHLRSIQIAGRELIFPWNLASRAFLTQWHHLLDLTGIPRKDHFGLHDLRKTLATNLWGSNPEAAVVALGHRDSTVTMGHYLDKTRIVAAALDVLPQPSAFTQQLASQT